MMLLWATPAFALPTQTITFSCSQPGLQNVRYGARPATLTASASSGLGIVWSVEGPATVDTNNARTITGAGTIAITATQPGDGAHAAASPVRCSFAAAKAPLTITAATNIQVHGDPVPPLVWAATGWVGGDTLYSSSSGKPVLATAATAASSPGTYPITLVAGNFAAANYVVSLVPGTLRVLAASPVGARTRTFSFPSDAMINVESYGVVHDGKTDDTTALLAALGDQRGYISGTKNCADFAGGGRSLYFPPGVYRFNQQLTWTCGSETALRGAGPAKTILRLDDRAAAFNGSSNLAALRMLSAVTPRGYGNIAFRNFVSGMTIDLGVGNSKAYGIDYTASNEGSMRDVRIVSESSDAAAGLFLSTTFPGPELIKDVAIYGGKYGIQAGTQALYSETYSHLTLAGQTAGAIFSPNMLIAAEQILSCTNGFAVQSGGQPIAILNSTFACGGDTSPAIKSDAAAYFRNIAIAGYTHSLVEKAHGVSLTGDIAEWFTPGKTASAFPEKAATLKMPVKEAPEVSDPPGATWCKLSSVDPAQWTAQLAACPVTTAYTSAGESTSTGGTYNIVVPARINHLRFFTSNRRPFGHVILNFNIAAGSSPLVIEDTGGMVNVSHTSARTIVLRDYAGAYTAQPGSGDVFGEDVGLGQGGLPGTATAFYPGQQVFIRQLNIELINFFPPGKDYRSRTGPCDGKTVMVGQCTPPVGTKLLADGAQVWLLGYKTEESTAELMLRNQARAEIFGMYMLPNNYNVQSDNRAFDVQDSSLTIGGLEEYIYASAPTQNTGHPHMILDRRGDVVKTVDVDQNRQQQMSLLYSFGQTTSPKTSSVTLTANALQRGPAVSAGSELQLSVREKGGATGLINWSVVSRTGGAQVTLYNLNASADTARLTVGAKAGRCLAGGTEPDAATLPSSVSFVIQAQSVDDPSKVVMFPFTVCADGASNRDAARP